MLSFFRRIQPAQPPRAAFIAGFGAFLGLAVLGLVSKYESLPLLIAPFGASCVLLFSVPASPLSQPVNVIGGHVLATLIALVFNMLLPDAWWSVALAGGVAIALMAALRMTHPPAGADVLVVFALDPAPEFLLLSVLAGSILLVAVAVLYHRASGIRYPVAGI